MQAERRLRDAVLALAPQAEFARRMINTGRLSTPTAHATPLSMPDETPFAGAARLGAPVPDAPVRRREGGEGHLLERLGGRFDLLYVKDGAPPHAPAGVRLWTVGEDFMDLAGLFEQRFDATPGAAFLLRPDQHLCARWRAFDAGKVAAARARALGHG
jgi:3-(3-hydroxy-phenyl)propionate hydroxylase